MEFIFILSSPARQENVGAAARAIKTMGISGLRLVNPLCDHLGERARATAHGSLDILEGITVYANLKHAVEDLSLLVGSAAKKRNIREDRHPVGELPGMLLKKGGMLNKVGILFGGEESGLSNEELDHCDLLTTIPMVRKYPSLNLGQAVMVYAATLSQITLSHAPRIRSETTEDELMVVRRKAREIMADVHLAEDNIIHRRIMERLMMLDQDDMHLFHSFCKFYLKKYHDRAK